MFEVNQRVEHQDRDWKGTIVAVEKDHPAATVAWDHEEGRTDFQWFLKLKLAEKE